MTRLKHLGTAMVVTALALTTSYGYLLENSFFDEDIAWDDGSGWDRYSFGDINAVTREDWASGAPGIGGPDGYAAENDGNYGAAFHGERSTGGGFFQAVEGIVPGADYYFEIESHASSDSPGGDDFPTTSVFQIDFEWYDGAPNAGGSLISSNVTIIVPTDGGSDDTFPTGPQTADNWEPWFVTNTAPSGATHAQVVIRWDALGTNSTAGGSNAVRWDNALLTTSATAPLNPAQGLADAMRLSYNTESSVTYEIESTPDLSAGFDDAGLPGVIGDDTVQEVYVAPSEDVNAYRLRVSQTPISTNFKVHPYDEGVTPNWIGYMDVYEIPTNGGVYLWGSSWGVGDLVSDVESCTNGGSTVLTLDVNSIGDPAEYWYIGGGGPGAQGNKVMGANLYNEFAPGELAGETVTFSGTVLANTLSNSHTAVAYIKDFAPDWSSHVAVTTNLTPGAFAISYTTDSGAGRHVQYGLNVTGPCVWITDAPAYGNVQIAIDSTPGFILEPVETDLELSEAGVLSWDAQLGVYFQPEYSDDLGSTWLPLGPVVVGDDTVMAIADPAGVVSGRTYRVIRTPTETPPAP